MKPILGRHLVYDKRLEGRRKIIRDLDIYKQQLDAQIQRRIKTETTVHETKYQILQNFTFRAKGYPFPAIENLI